MIKYKILVTYNVTLEFEVALDFDPRIGDNWCIKYATFYADNNDGSEVEVEPIYIKLKTHMISNIQTHTAL